MNISNENLENELLEEIENLLEQFDEVEEIELPDDLELQELQEANIYSVVATRQGSYRDYHYDSKSNLNPINKGKRRAEIYKRKIYAKTPQDAIAKFKKLQAAALGPDSKYIKEPRVVRTVPAERAKTDELGRKPHRGDTFIKHKDGVKNLDKHNAHIRVVTKTDKGLKPGFRNPKSGELEHPYKNIHPSQKNNAPIRRAVYTNRSKAWKPDDHIEKPDYNPIYRNIKRNLDVGEGKIMEQKIKDLIDNIEIGNAEAINSSFSTVMAEKVSARLDSLKQEVASTIFKDKETNN